MTMKTFHHELAGASCRFRKLRLIFCLIAGNRDSEARMAYRFYFKLTAATTGNIHLSADIAAKISQ
jgi:hypothetical protein